MGQHVKICINPGTVSSPNDTWVCPAGVYFVILTGCGGGGGGAGSGGFAGGTLDGPPAVYSGGSGGGGAVGSTVIIPVIPGHTYKIAVGIGGSGGGIAQNGVNGTDTSFFDQANNTVMLAQFYGASGGFMGIASNLYDYIAGGPSIRNLNTEISAETYAHRAGDVYNFIVPTFLQYGGSSLISAISSDLTYTTSGNIYSSFPGGSAPATFQTNGGRGGAPGIKASNTAPHAFFGQGYGGGGGGGGGAGAFGSGGNGGNGGAATSNGIAGSTPLANTGAGGGGGGAGGSSRAVQDEDDQPAGNNAGGGNGATGKLIIMWNT